MTMLSDDGRDLWVGWDDYHRLIEKLALKVHASAWDFDQILCLARGGMRPGDVLSRIFSKPLAVLATSSYREQAGTLRGALDLAAHATIARGPLQGRVLLVDDLIDSGETLQAVAAQLRGNAAITELRSAVLWVKGESTSLPDYYVEMLPSSPWIHQPFEDYDALDPSRLADRLAAGTD